MKNLFVSIIICLIFIFSACTKKEEKNTSINPNSINVGELHNKSLDYLYKEKRISTFSGTKSLTTKTYCDYIGEYLILSGLDEDDVNKGVNESKEFFNEIEDTGRGLNLDGFMSDYDNIRWFLKQNCNASYEFTTELNKVFNMSDSLKADELLLYVNSNFKNKNWQAEDKELADVFADVFNNSYNYWSINNNRLEDDTWVIINDGIGGVLGLAFGGIGSVIVGTTFSAYTNEELSDN